MKKGFIILGLTFLLGLFSCAKKPDRSALVALMDQYLEALTKHDPASVPLASDVKLVENTEVTPIGKGLWETATGGATNFKIYVADPVANQIGFLGVIEQNHKPTIIGARLKLVDGKITEIDHLIIPHYEDSLNPNMSKVRPGLVTPIDPSERVPRNEMLKIANSYYEALVHDDGNLAPFADECQRRENGGTTANYDPNSGEIVKKDNFYVLRQLKCGKQLNTGCMAYITDINDRRFSAVDEKMGLVFAFSIFRHNGEPKIIPIKGVPGITETKNDWGPFDLPAAHIFKIRNGKIYEIEAIGYVAEHGIKNGWE